MTTIRQRNDRNVWSRIDRFAPPFSSFPHVVTSSASSYKLHRGRFSHPRGLSSYLCSGRSILVWIWQVFVAMALLLYPSQQAVVESRFNVGGGRTGFVRCCCVQVCQDVISVHWMFVATADTATVLLSWSGGQKCCDDCWLRLFLQHTGRITTPPAISLGSTHSTSWNWVTDKRDSSLKLLELRRLTRIALLLLFYSILFYANVNLGHLCRLTRQFK